MIDWTRQAEDLPQAWADGQPELLRRWGDTARSIGWQGNETWLMAVGSWEGAVKNGLDAQLEWSHQASERLRALPNAPEALIAWAEHIREVGDRWHATQQQLWDSYFGMVRKTAAVDAQGTVDDEDGENE